MKNLDDIKDEQIRVVGQKIEQASSSRKTWIFIVLFGLLLLGFVTGIWIYKHNNDSYELSSENLSFFEEVMHCVEPIDARKDRRMLGRYVDSLDVSYTEIKDTFINDIPIKIYIPHNAEMTLHVGRMNRKDKSIIYAAQAADVRADNGKIVGAFVLKGEPRAWGLSKKGYCACINGEVTIGTAENSPLFEKATEDGGYFFRQYPLVCNGKLIENEPKGKSIRRAICDRIGEIFMVETGTTESFHDFSQALVDLGVDNAVYLVGSSAYGWTVDKDGKTHEFGEDNYYRGRRRMPKNTSYIVWRKKV